ncbi:3-phosphoshikimate 1-carboxyvinyltransferase [Bdellovibrionota bacterium FG-1]
MQKTIRKAARFEGKPKIPGDKSISHRALIFGALAEGRTEVIDLLESGDVHSTAKCLADLGVKITREKNIIYVDGVGARGFTQPSKVLDCGNSGTTIRLLMGVLAGRGITATLTGDASLRGRPMKRVAAPLQLMGAQFSLTQENYAPLTVTGARLRGIDYDLKIASAQIKTSVMLAALCAEGVTTISGEIHSRDHTERLLRHFGVPVDVSATSIRIQGGMKLRATSVTVPGDPSTAAFWIASAGLIPGAQLELENISLNPTRIGFIRAMQKMGANITTRITSELPEPIGQVRVTPGTLHGIRITEAEVPSLIDELPLLAVVASQACGVTEVGGAKELRVKETDRIEAVAVNLRAMGIEIEVREDGFKIEGPQRLKSASLDSFHDHRIAMAFSIAGLMAEGETQIQDADCVGISYPQFFTTLEELTRP